MYSTLTCKLTSVRLGADWRVMDRDRLPPPPLSQDILATDHTDRDRLHPPPLSQDILATDHTDFAGIHNPFGMG
jgi:hypothetical protein